MDPRTTEPTAEPKVWTPKQQNQQLNLKYGPPKQQNWQLNLKQIGVLHLISTIKLLSIEKEAYPDNLHVIFDHNT